MGFPTTLSAVRWRRVLVAVALVQLASSLIFALTVHHKVFDEVNYDWDVGRYEREGVTAASIRAHVTAAGSGMPILASFGGRLAPGSLVARRVPVFLTWVVAVALLVALSRQRSGDAIIPIAGAVIVGFPHTPLSMATLLSEGPAFGCAMAALLLSGLARAQGDRPETAVRILLAGFCLGLGLWFRQYYLALVPAFALGWWLAPDRVRAWALFAVGPIVALGILFALWGGLTSAAARAGAGYGAGVRAAVTFNPWRPFSALAYVGAYALPLLPWGDRERLPLRALLGLAGLAGVVAIAFGAAGHSVWGQGPILALISATGRVRPFVPRVVDVAATAAAFVGVLVIARLAWTSREARPQSLLLVCAAAVILFALEQLGIDGSIPFYERYAHQVIFFSTALVLLVAPPPRAARVLAFVGVLILVSQMTLWGKA